MDEIKSEILSYIKMNRVSSTEVADCLGKTGVLEDVNPVNPGMFRAGFIRYIYAHSESNWSIHEQARDVQNDEIVVMDGIHTGNRALVGELVTKFIIYYKRAEAIVSLQKMRDANDLIKNRYPVWCKGFTPVGCFNEDVPETEEIKQIARARKDFYDGALAVCDDTGVVVVPKSVLDEDFLKKLEFIEHQEDVWFNCIDSLKMNTFETVCLKKYLKDK